MMPVFPNSAFRKSTRSNPDQECVECAPGDQACAVRDSKDQDGPQLHFARREFGAFLRKVKAGAYDLA